MSLWPWKKQPQRSPAEMSREMREHALRVTPSELNITPTRDLPHVFGVLMETAYPGAVASLVAFVEGSTSLYFSSGGGIIGAGEHESVRAALGPFFRAAEDHRHQFTVTHATPLPEPGRVRFYLRTFEGTVTAEADEEDLGEMRHPLSPLFHAGHAVIAAVREATPD